MRPSIADNGILVSRSYIPLPWQVFAEFWRMVWVGCVATIGPRAGRRLVPVYETDHASSYTELAHR